MMKAQPGVSHASVIKAYTASRVHDIMSATLLMHYTCILVYYYTHLSN